MKRILIDIRGSREALARLEKLPGIQVTAIEPSDRPRELPTDLIRDQELLVCTYPPTNVGDMKNLEWIQLASVGYSQLYGLGLVERNIRACNARGVFDTSIAEWNLAMMINLARDLRGMIRNQEHGHWEKQPRFENEIHGRTLGLWGYGGIGRETARLAKTLDMRVHVLTKNGIKARGKSYTVPGTGDPEGKLPDRVFTAHETSEFLAGVDYLVLAMPLTPANAGIMGEKELQEMKRTAYLLNPARGPLVQEQALLRALREGWIAGAALDTHYYYPMPADHPLWRFPNVIMTPHISGSDHGPYFVERMWDIVIHNVESLLSGKPLWNELTAAELKGA